MKLQKKSLIGWAMIPCPTLIPHPQAKFSPVKVKLLHPQAKFSPVRVKWILKFKKQKLLSAFGKKLVYKVFSLLELLPH
jgi:hypothetical protein